MARLEQQLSAGETRVCTAKPHWFAVGGRGAVLVVSGAVWLFVLVRAGWVESRVQRLAVYLEANDPALEGMGSPQGLQGVIRWVAAAVLAIIAVKAYRLVAWRLSVEYGVTNRRVMQQPGLIRRRTRDDLLSQIESVRVEQGLLGRILNFGTVSLTSAGGSAQSWKRVSKPREVAEAIESAVEERAGRGEKG